ncbi:MAG: hypothetical protein M3082_22175 [Candidatus Dormibacteraeota bacterium]|nr:hypothetical protein [Candidatus Dormibacteraeota bacterium]
MDLPGYGTVLGEWDLRDGIREYLGNVNFNGKRVLEMGTASGYVGFHMEKAGAQVIGYDLSDMQEWDVVPFARDDRKDFLQKRREHIRRINNAYWLSHRAVGSKNKIVYGDVYSVPREIGNVDICTFGSILLHVRDPFLALEKALALTREMVIVTDLVRLRSLSTWHRVSGRILRQRRAAPSLRFLPDWRTSEPKDTWWRLSPQTIQEFVGVLGFEQTSVTYHYQAFVHKEPDGHTRNARLRHFTLVGKRTAGAFN